MVSIVVAKSDETLEASFPSYKGMTFRGPVQTKSVVTESGRPLILWQHVLQPHGEIRWNKPDVSHLVYVKDGVADATGQQLAKDGMLLVAHGAETMLRAGDKPLTLLHFHQPADVADPKRTGGCVHVVNKKQAQRYTYDDPEGETKHTEGVVFANASCPSCGVWFHESVFPGGVTVARHSHTEDEIIYVLDGCLKLGRQDLTAGGALAVDANTMYTFKTGADGLRFVNFRPSEPYTVLPTPDGGRTAPMNERQWMDDHTVRA